MKLYLSLLLLMPSMQAMHNQIMPIENDSHQSDQAVVTAALPSDSPVLHPKLVPLVAANIRSYSNPEASAITKAVVLAANDALGDSVSKTNTAYITAGATIITAIITSLASTYGKNC